MIAEAAAPHAGALAHALVFFGPATAVLAGVLRVPAAWPVLLAAATLPHLDALAWLSDSPPLARLAMALVLVLVAGLPAWSARAALDAVAAHSTIGPSPALRMTTALTAPALFAAAGGLHRLAATRVATPAPDSPEAIGALLAASVGVALTLATPGLLVASACRLALALVDRAAPTTRAARSWATPAAVLGLTFVGPWLLDAAVRVARAP